MDRRNFLQLLGSGALMAMLVPSVAQAFQSGHLSEDELFTLLQDGSDSPVLITQEAKVVARMNQQVDGKALVYGLDGTYGLEVKDPPTGEDINYSKWEAPNKKWVGGYAKGWEKVKKSQKVTQTFEVMGPAEKKAYLKGPSCCYPEVVSNPELAHLDPSLGKTHIFHKYDREDQQRLVENYVDHRKFVPGRQLGPDGEPLYRNLPLVEVKEAAIEALQKKAYRYQLTKVA